MPKRHDNHTAQVRQPVRTCVWFEGGRLMTNNPAAFASQFHLPTTPPTDDGKIIISVPITDVVRGGAV